MREKISRLKTTVTSPLSIPLKDAKHLTAFAIDPLCYKKRNNKECVHCYTLASNTSWQWSPLECR